MPLKKIYACIPGYGNVMSPQVTGAFMNAKPRGFDITQRLGNSSLLARGFNIHWATALGDDYDYFVMLHSDICPAPGWMDTLVEMMEEGVKRPTKNSGSVVYYYDVISAVVPIKGPTGVTSTAIGSPEGQFSLERRLTLKEAFNMPYPTFDAIDLCNQFDLLDPKSYPLLVNTGCLIVNLKATYPEGHEFAGQRKFLMTDQKDNLVVYFNINDEIGVNRGIIEQHGISHKAFTIRTEPEDWFFSRRCTLVGANVAATLNVRLVHIGETSFNNYHPWGFDGDIKSTGMTVAVEDGK